jgi:hypothetical protein
MQKTFSLLPLVLPSGERLPTLVDSETWIPVKVGTQWAVRHRRYRVQASTLAQDLRAIARLYDWSWKVLGVDLDDFLFKGQTLSTAEANSLAEQLRFGREITSLQSGDTQISEADSQPAIGLNNQYDRQLSVIEEFSIWALDEGNRGGGIKVPLQQMALLQSQLKRTFQSLRHGFVPSKRIESLDEVEIAKIREVTAPLSRSLSLWTFPKQGFSCSTQLRNWLMVETALDLGLRRGELLKLRIDSLLRGGADGIRVLRCPDDPHDSRVREPAVKSAERVLPLSPSLQESIQAYLSLPSPQGRGTGKTRYLFTTLTGNPLSLSAADSIAKNISDMSGIHFSWHRLRHTWAETLADQLLSRENGLEVLAYLGGWTNPKSAERYIENARHRQAYGYLKDYQATL